MTGKRRYRYILHPMEDSSYRYGPCEVCGDFVPEIYSQVEEMEYTHPDGSKRWTRYGCQSMFGHKECLIGRRR